MAMFAVMLEAKPLHIERLAVVRVMRFDAIDRPTDLTGLAHELSVSNCVIHEVARLIFLVLTYLAHQT